MIESVLMQQAVCTVFIGEVSAEKYWEWRLFSHNDVRCVVSNIT